MTKEKKKTIIITVILAVVALALIAIFVVGELKKSGVITSKEDRAVLSEFYKNFESKERTIIYYASTGCGYCDAYAQAIASKIGNMNKSVLLSNLLAVTDIKYIEDNGFKYVDKVKVNFPVSFTVTDQHNTYGALTLTVNFEYEFEVIKRGTSIDKKLFAIPIYVPYVIKFTDNAVTASGTTVEIDNDKINQSYFAFKDTYTYLYEDLYYCAIDEETYTKLISNQYEKTSLISSLVKENHSTNTSIDLSSKADGKYYLVAYYLDMDGSKVIKRISDNVVELNKSGSSVTVSPEILSIN